jgi:tol-pal system protein YbgF
MKRFTLLLAFFCISAAHAALFEDDEARKAILDLRQKIEKQTDEIKQFQRSLIEQQNLFESLRDEMQRLRGEKEDLLEDIRKQHALTQTASQALDERLKNIDERLKKLEPLKVKLDNVEFLAEPAETRQYEAALSAFRKGEFTAASDTFTDFIKRHPSSGYLALSLFWLGNAQYANREYKEAIKNFNSLITKDPEHARAPDALLSIANCLLEMKDIKSARKALEDVMKKYPQSESASAAKERLSKLK